VSAARAQGGIEDSGPKSVYTTSVGYDGDEMKHYSNMRITSGNVSLLAIVLCGQALTQAVDRFPDHDPKSGIDPGLAYSLPANVHNRITLPRLSRFPDAAAMKAVNTDLSLEEQKLHAERSDCFDGHEHKATWEQMVRVAVLTRDVLSIEYEAFVYCGGVHPFEEYKPLTYNMRTGKRFDFDRDAGEIFKAEKLPVKDLIDLYKQKYPQHYGDCDASIIKPNSDLYLHFEPVGLAIIPNLPHVIAACGPAITISYRELRPLLKDGNPFQTVIGL
jgi:hypothetical protein